MVLQLMGLCSVSAWLVLFFGVERLVAEDRLVADDHLHARDAFGEL